MKTCNKCGETKGALAWKNGGNVCSHCQTMKRDEVKNNNCKMVDIDRARDHAEFKKLMGGMFG